MSALKVADCSSYGVPVRDPTLLRAQNQRFLHQVATLLKLMCKDPHWESPRAAALLYIAVRPSQKLVLSADTWLKESRPAISEISKSVPYLRSYHKQ